MAHKHKDKSDCVSLDLFVGDEDDEPSTTQNNVVETLCLRILTKKGINFRFGGIQLHVKSPDFHIGKSFHVSLDENNHIESIESYREPEDSYLFGRRRVSLLGGNNLGALPARILVTPKKLSEEQPTVAAAVNNSTSSNSTNNVINNIASNVSTTNSLNNNILPNASTTANKTIQNKNKLPILTADVVVEEIQEKLNQESTTQIASAGQSLGQALMNTFLNKKSNSNTSSVNNSPSQSIHSINSLSSSMLELRITSPINTTSSPEKLISKLTLFGHAEKKYIKHKSKKYDFKKRSKEKLLKNGEKNDSDKNGGKNIIINKDVVTKEVLSDKVNEKSVGKADEKVNDKIEHKKSDQLEYQTTKNSVQTKSVCTHCTHLDAVDMLSNLDNLSNSSLNISHGFFYNLRRTRSWKK